MRNIAEEINELLDEVERVHEVEILYACESGSRAWGFASPDSDYDIRFIYKRKRDDYLRVSELADTIEIPIENDLDPGGWDLRKSLGLLKKSNGALIEWLHSPIVYREKEGFLDHWRKACLEVMSAGKLHAHYCGISRRFWKTALHDGDVDAGDVRAKSYLYCLRGALSARYVAREKKPAPVKFEKLLGCLPNDLLSVVDDLLEHKSESGEKQGMSRLGALDEFLKDEVENGKVEGLDDGLKQGDRDEIVDTLFLATLGESQKSEKGVSLMRKADFTLNRVRRDDMLLFEAVGGSVAYGTNTPESDEDLRGVFAAPQSFLTAAESIDQVQDEKGDEVYYELGRFVDLLSKSNPNALEMLFMPKDCIRHRHPVMDLLDPKLFLTKKCEMSFGGYALGQVKKARGLNKKIVNPEPEQRLELRDFCYIMSGQGSVKLEQWLKQCDLEESDLGVSAVNHAPNTYAIFKGPEYRGVFARADEPEVICSSIKKGEEPLGWMTCNIDGYKSHCKNHKEYWNWVKKRNENRYLINSQHDRGYDSKHMMHTLRLLEVAQSIAEEGTIQLRSPNVDFLMQVRRGEFAYDELLKMAEEKMAILSQSYTDCDLPQDVDFYQVNDVLAEMRERIYSA